MEPLLRIPRYRSCTYAMYLFRSLPLTGVDYDIFIHISDLQHKQYETFSSASLCGGLIALTSDDMLLHSHMNQGADHWPARIFIECRSPEIVQTEVARSK